MLHKNPEQRNDGRKYRDHHRDQKCILEPFSPREFHLGEGICRDQRQGNSDDKGHRCRRQGIFETSEQADTVACSHAEQVFVIAPDEGFRQHIFCIGKHLILRCNGYDKRPDKGPQRQNKKNGR